MCYKAFDNLRILSLVLCHLTKLFNCIIKYSLWITCDKIHPLNGLTKTKPRDSSFHQKLIIQIVRMTFWFFSQSFPLSTSIWIVLQVSPLPLPRFHLFCNSPSCLLHNFHEASLKNFALDKLMIPFWCFSLFSPIICLTLYYHCKVKLCLGHWWEVKD